LPDYGGGATTSIPVSNAQLQEGSFTVVGHQGLFIEASTFAKAENCFTNLQCCGSSFDVRRWHTRNIGCTAFCCFCPSFGFAWSEHMGHWHWQAGKHQPSGAAGIMSVFESRAVPITQSTL
jgi:hypothetical protein